MFRHFLSGELSLSHDATPYYGHIKFFLDNIRQGVFPLWDPTRQHGVPNDFFLRRIGAYNPIYLYILLLNKAGLSYTQAYLCFLAGYFWLGAIGIYALTQRLVQNQLSALVAFLLFLFSSIGTRLFDTYLILVLTPIIGFFYFLVSFFISNTDPKRQRVYFLGIVLMLMVIINTYIPFYFLTIILSFLLCWAICYGTQLPTYFKQIFCFIKSFRLTVIAGLLALSLACIPNMLFFQQAQQGSMVLSSRHTDANDKNIINVDIKTTSSWSALDELAFAYFFTKDLTTFHFSVFYISIWGLLLLLLAGAAPLKRITVFIVLWGISLLLMLSPNISPIYHFLYKKVFFFKYFRNLHFFIWLMTLPLLTVLMGILFKEFFQYLMGHSHQQRKPLYIILGLHGLAFGLYFLIATPHAASYITIASSLLFFSIIYFKRPRTPLPLALGLLILISIEPFFAYRHLSENVKNAPPNYAYDLPYQAFTFTRGKQIDIPPLKTRKRHPRGAAYFSTQWYNQLITTIDHRVLENYLYHTLIAYDHIQSIPDTFLKADKIESLMTHLPNTALVNGPTEVPPKGLTPNPSPKAFPIKGNNKFLTVITSSVNHLTLATHFPTTKFLVFNDAFHPKWQAFIDNKPVMIQRANIAFKGIWIPAGTHRVTWRYGSSIASPFNWALLILFIIMTGLLMWQLTTTTKNNSTQKTSLPIQEFYIPIYTLWGGILLLSVFFINPTQLKDTAKYRILNRLLPNFQLLINEAPIHVSPIKWRLFNNYYRRILEFMPKRADAWHILGYCEAHAHNRKKALEAFEQAYALAPNFFWNAYNLGLFYFQEARYPEAIRVLNHALRLPYEPTLKTIYAEKIYYDILRPNADQPERLMQSLQNGRRDALKLLIWSQQHINSPEHKNIPEISLKFKIF